MKIETKFNIGDKVYPIEKVNDIETTTCDVCSGTGKVKIENSDLKAICPLCTFGKIHKVNKISYYPCGSRILEKILISKKSIEYLDEFSNPIPEDELFTTKDDALEYCIKKEKEQNK